MVVGDAIAQSAARGPLGRCRRLIDSQTVAHYQEEEDVKLGFLTAPFPETPLMEVADWAAGADFEVLEIACWPMSSGAKRKYAGTAHIDVANLSDAQAGEIKAEIAEKGLDISGLGFYPNPLHPDLEVARRGHRPPQGGHRGHRQDGPAGDQHVLRRRRLARTSTRTGRRRSRSGRTSSGSRRTTGSS